MPLHGVLESLASLVGPELELRFVFEDWYRVMVDGEGQADGFRVEEDAEGRALRTKSKVSLR